MALYCLATFYHRPLISAILQSYPTGISSIYFLSPHYPVSDYVIDCQRGILQGTPKQSSHDVLVKAVTVVCSLLVYCSAVGYRYFICKLAITFFIGLSLMFVSFGFGEAYRYIVYLCTDQG